jgi:hypothetical protein
MNGKIKQEILEALRLGIDPDDLITYLEDMERLIKAAKLHTPSRDLHDFYTAIQDSNHAP